LFSLLYHSSGNPWMKRITGAFIEPLIATYQESKKSTEISTS
jgi:hypothetical protein